MLPACTVAGTLLAVLMVGTPAAGLGQGRWERQVQERLQRAVTALHPAETGPRVFTKSGPLNEEESAWLELSLIEGMLYAMVGVCDDDCLRLQLVVTTVTGSELAKDRTSENLPTLRFTPNRSMRYRVRVVLEECRVNPCWYAVAVVPLRSESPDNPRSTP